MVEKQPAIQLFGGRLLLNFFQFHGATNESSASRLARAIQVSLTVMDRLIRYLCMAAFLIVVAEGQAQTLYIPQIADGGGWQTTLVLTNAGTSAATVSISFFLDTGNGNTQGWNLSFVEALAQPYNIAAGATVYLHTLGTAGSTSVGWAAVNGSPGITAYAIFTQRVPGRQDQDGTAIAAPASSRFLVPFDATNGAAVGFAIANIGGSADTVSVAVRTSNGTVISGSLTVPGQGHFAFSLTDPSSPLGSTFAAAINGQTGLAEFYATTAALSVLTLRFNATLSFTAAPVYAEGGPAVIGTPLPTSAPPFSQLFVSGAYVVNGVRSPGLYLLISPDGSGGYYVYIVQINIPSNLPIGLYSLAEFTGGTLSGQSLTFNSGAKGTYYGQQVMSGSLTLTVNNFTQIGSTVTGTLTLVTGSGSGMGQGTTTTGSVTGAVSTYLP